MAFELTNTHDNSLIHKNSLSEKDFNIPELADDDWMVINHPKGEMKMKQWVFDGVRMSYADCTFREPVSLNWQGDLDIVTMYFSLKGGVSIGSGHNASLELGNNEQNMFYGTQASGFMKVDDQRLKSFMLQFNKEAFLRIASGGTDALKYFADAVADNNSTTFSHKNLPIDVSSQQSIDAIMNCRFSNSLKRIFFLSKAMELLVLQADAHTRALSDKYRYIKTEYDKDRIIFARDYLLQHIESPPTVAELAKIAGINEFKLKKGYKEIFGTTIFGHLADVRFDLSKVALLEGKKSLSEIALDLGYSSIQHFSTAFKKKFGFPPKQAKGKLL